MAHDVKDKPKEDLKPDGKVGGIVIFEGLYKSTEGKGNKKPYEINVWMSQEMIGQNALHVFIKKDLNYGAQLMKDKYPDFESFVEYHVKKAIPDIPGMWDGILSLMNREDAEAYIIKRGLGVESRLYKDIHALITAIEDYQECQRVGKVDDFLVKQDVRRKNALDRGENLVVREDVHDALAKSRSLNSLPPEPVVNHAPSGSGKTQHKKDVDPGV